MTNLNVLKKEVVSNLKNSSIKHKAITALPLIKILYNAPGISPLELVTKDTVKRLDQFFKTISQEVRKNFSNPKLISTLEFPSFFRSKTK